MARNAPYEATHRNAAGERPARGGDGATMRDNATFGGLLQQLDALLTVETQTWQAAEPPIAIPAQPGPREPRELQAPPQAPVSPPAAVPQPRMPSRQEQGSHALERRQGSGEPIVRPVVKRLADQTTGHHKPRHAAEPDEQLAVVLPWPKQKPPTEPAKQERQERGVPPGRWKTVLACASALAIAGASAATATDSGREVMYRILQAESNAHPPAHLAPEAIQKGAAPQQKVPDNSTADRQPAHPNNAHSSLPQHPPVPSQAPTAVHAYTEALNKVPKAQLKGVCASLLLAQAVVISNEGKTQAARQFNNPFGIRNARGALVRYASLDKGIAAQARRITSSPYYRDGRFFPDQNPASCAANGRTALLGTDAKTARMNLIFAYFTRRGLPAHQTAGMIGNFERESGINPATVQTKGGSARGLAQWEKHRYASRPTARSPRLGLKNFTAQKGLPWHDLYGQLQFVDYEFAGFERPAYRALRATKTVDAATNAFAYKFERPNPAPRKIRMDIRRAAAKRALAHHASLQRAAQATQQLIVSYDLARV